MARPPLGPEPGSVTWPWRQIPNLHSPAERAIVWSARAAGDLRCSRMTRRKGELAGDCRRDKSLDRTVTSPAPRRWPAQRQLMELNLEKADPGRVGSDPPETCGKASKSPSSGAVPSHQVARRHAADRGGQFARRVQPVVSLKLARVRRFSQFWLIEFGPGGVLPGVSHPSGSGRFCRIEGSQPLTDPHAREWPRCPSRAAANGLSDVHGFLRDVNGSKTRRAAGSRVETPSLQLIALGDRSARRCAPATRPPTMLRSPSLPLLLAFFVSCWSRPAFSVNGIAWTWWRGSAVDGVASGRFA